MPADRLVELRSGGLETLEHGEGFRERGIHRMACSGNCVFLCLDLINSLDELIEDRLRLGPLGHASVPQCVGLGNEAIELLRGSAGVHALQQLVTGLQQRFICRAGIVDTFQNDRHTVILTKMPALVRGVREEGFHGILIVADLLYGCADRVSCFVDPRLLLSRQRLYAIKVAMSLGKIFADTRREAAGRRHVVRRFFEVALGLCVLAR